jgi:hypothetical protein
MAENKDEESFDIFRDLQIISLKNFMHPDENAFYRRLCRWFSAEFHTSIFEVEKRPLEYLLVHYFEHKLEKMSKEDFIKYKRFLLHEEEILEEEEEDEEFMEQLELEFIKRRQAELDAKKKQEEATKPPPPDISIKF